MHANNTDELTYLPKSTAGFAALGTPFRGSEVQSLAGVVARILAPVGAHDGIIKELTPDNNHLKDKVHQFANLREKFHISICCFVEYYDSDYGKWLKIPGVFQGRVRSGNMRIRNLIN